MVKENFQFLLDHARLYLEQHSLWNTDPLAGTFFIGEV